MKKNTSSPRMPLGASRSPETNSHQSTFLLRRKAKQCLRIWTPFPFLVLLKVMHGEFPSEYVIFPLPEASPSNGKAFDFMIFLHQWSGPSPEGV